jgi:uncharacterized membrane protein
MKLTKDELEFIQEFEVQRKNRTKTVIFGSLFFATLLTLFGLFDSDFSFHLERLNSKQAVFKFISSLIIWAVIQIASIYFREKKYKKLILKKEK